MNGRLGPHMSTVSFLVRAMVGSVNFESLGVALAGAASWVVGSAASRTVILSGVRWVAVRATGWVRMAALLAALAVLGAVGGCGLAHAAGAKMAATRRAAAIAGTTGRRTSDYFAVF